MVVILWIVLWAGGYSKELLKFDKTKVVALDRDVHQVIKIADQLKINFNLDLYFTMKDLVI